MDYRTNNRRNNQEQPTHRRFVRGADGRLQLAEPGPQDIGDVWAEQKRIRLSEAIEADRRKAEKAKGRTVPKEIVLNIGVPKIRLPKIKRPKFTIPKKKLFIGAAAAVCLLSVTGFMLFLSNSKQEGDRGVLAAGNATPTFETLLPASKSIDELGGWVKVSPSNSQDPAFAYADSVQGVTLNVTQQQLPASFKSDPPGKLAELAGQFGANETGVTPDGIKFYVGTSIKGPQSTLVVKRDLLILIKSASRLSMEQWTEYVTGLR